MKQVYHNLNLFSNRNTIKILLCICLFIQFKVYSQQNHYIYFQTDNNQPFNVNINNQYFSSTTNGYLTIPKLQEGEIQLTVGFAGTQIEEQTFNCTILNRDLGFTIKNLPNKGWALFDLQSLKIINAIEKENKTETTQKVEPTNNKVEPTIISPKQEIEVTNPIKIENSDIKKQDSIISTPKDILKKDENLQKPIIVEEKKEQTKEIVQPVNKDEEPIVQETKEIKPSYKLSTVSKTAQIKSTDGLHLVFHDQLETSIDTIYALISFENNNNTVQKSNNTSNNKEIIEDTTVKKAIRELYNSACITLATDDDFFKLRKKMASQTDDEKMIAEATKIYKSKCFDVQQIRNLSTLFLSDGGRFQFFKASINHVYDFVNFSNLEKELNDESIIKLFKNLLN